MTVVRIPKVNALLVSLDAKKDGETGRLDLIGVIGAMQVPTLPVQLPGLAVLVSLTNLQGSYRLAVELIDLEQDERMAGVRQEEPFSCFDPLRVWTEVARVPGPLVIQHAGRYACRLLLDDNYLDEVVFEVLEANGV